MSISKLPERASLEYLKKLAKDRLHELRQTDPQAKLATALLSIARDHGFPSWRALKAELAEQQSKNTAIFFEACAQGDVEALQGLLTNDPNLARATNPLAAHAGWTGLHTASQRAHSDAVRLLLEHRADPNARESGDNTYPLHWAAAQGNLGIVRSLLDAGADVHGFGDAHQLDVIGWATFYHATGGNPQVIELLLERGARHHIFSAIAAGDLRLIQNLVEQNPEALDRRMSRFEQARTALHFAISRKRDDILDLLIGLGADLEAQDKHGRTALDTAMLQGDQEAMRRLHAAGAKPPQPIESSNSTAALAKMADSIQKSVPMLSVPDIAATLDWYTSIGFKEINRYEDAGQVNFGMLAFGQAEIMLTLDGGKPGAHDTSLWFYTSEIDPLYRLLKSRQLAAAQTALAGESPDHPAVEFVEDIYDPFYGGRQFGIRDLNGYNLYFLQPAKAKA